VFLLVVLVGGLLYVVCGVAYAVKVQQRPLGPEALPHRAVWEEIYGLAVDGLGWTQAKVMATLGVGAGGAAAAKDDGGLAQNLSPDDQAAVGISSAQDSGDDSDIVE
jgi:hypothetical protein